MLVLSRKNGQQIIIETSNGPVIVQVIKIQGNRVSVGVIADKSVKVMREEIGKGK